MSDSYGMDAPGATRPASGMPGDDHGQSSGSSGKADAAKEQAANLKDTVTDEATSVVGTAKNEAASVAQEAKSQARNLFAQTTDELSAQLHDQQQRLSGGLRTAGEDLRSMADASSQDGMASEIVREISHRVESIGDWLGDRTPSSVFSDVKRYARRKPGTFILIAAVAGIAVGRLSRSLASGASTSSDTSRRTGQLSSTPMGGGRHQRTSTGSAPLVSGTEADATIGRGADAAGGAVTGESAGTTTGLGTGTQAFPAAPDGVGGAASNAPGTPLYDQVAAPRTDQNPAGGGDDRSDSL